MGGQPARVVDLAARNDESHAAAIYSARVSEIRPATPAELPLLARIEAEGDEQFAEWFGRPTGWDPPSSGNWRARQPGFLLVTGSPVFGFAHVIEADGHCHLEQLCVARRQQGSGHGRALVLAVKAEAAASGYAEVSLFTYADVPWNAPFYRRCGFVEREPVAPFHVRLRAVEQQRGLDRLGRRVLMVAPVEG